MSQDESQDESQNGNLIPREKLFAQADEAGDTAVGAQIQILKNHFPQCFDKSGAFLPEKLAESLRAAGVDTRKEFYTLNWLGKSYAKVLAHVPPNTLLAENTAHNGKPENAASQNLLIKGDNLEVLKHLKNAYRGAVKMIYIDPPYNTGSDGFVYQDDRKFTPEQLAELGGMDVDEAKRVLDFTAKKSNSHSAWLTFMYPRLYVARELLREDGVIFISIDDNEQAQLKLLCDEVFGEENFVAEIIWKNATDNNPSNVSIEHEYLIVYSRNRHELEGVWTSGLSDVKNTLISFGAQTLAESANLEDAKRNYSLWFKENKHQLGKMDRYKYIDSGGVYTGSQSVHNPGREGYRYDVIHPETGLPCKQPLMGYRFVKETMDALLEEGRILFGKDHNKIIELKVYVEDFKDKLNSVFDLDGRTGAYDLKILFGVNQVFTNPKPVDLIFELLSFASANDSIIFDFFAGSGTTAHAVMQLNAEDGGQRRYICVQLPEETYEKSEAHKAGYQTIFDIAKARIEKAAAKIRAGHPDFQGDLGFRIFETVPGDGLLADAEFDPEQADMALPSLNDTDLHTLLTTWRVHDGQALTDAVQPVELAGHTACYTAYLCGTQLYVLHAGFDSQALKALVQRLDGDAAFKPERVVFYGPQMPSAMQHELHQAITGYANKKSLNMTVLARY